MRETLKYEFKMDHEAINCGFYWKKNLADFLRQILIRRLRSAAELPVSYIRKPAMTEAETRGYLQTGLYTDKFSSVIIFRETRYMTIK